MAILSHGNFRHGFAMLCTEILLLTCIYASENYKVIEDKNALADDGITCLCLRYCTQLKDELLHEHELIVSI